MGMLLFFICKLSFCLFYIAFKDRRVLSLLSPLLLQPQAALPSNNSNKCYFQMGGPIRGSAMWLCTGIDYLSLYLSHFTSVSCLIFFSEFWRTLWKLLPLICPRGHSLEKCLNVVLNVLVKRAQSGKECLGPGKFPLLQLSSSALLSLMLGRGGHNENLFLIPFHWWRCDIERNNPPGHKAVDTYEHFRISRLNYLLRLFGTKQGSQIYYCRIAPNLNFYLGMDREILPPTLSFLSARN